MSTEVGYTILTVLYIARFIYSFESSWHIYSFKNLHCENFVLYCTIMYLEERVKGENVIKCEILELKFQLSLQVKHWNQYFSVMGWV